jgi:hypothetical protein
MLDPPPPTAIAISRAATLILRSYPVDLSSIMCVREKTQRSLLDCYECVKKVSRWNFPDKGARSIIKLRPILAIKERA